MISQECYRVAPDGSYGAMFGVKELCSVFRWMRKRDAWNQNFSYTAQKDGNCELRVLASWVFCPTGQMPNISPAVFLNLVVLGWKARMIIGWFDVPAGGFSKTLTFYAWSFIFSWTQDVFCVFGAERANGRRKEEGIFGRRWCFWLYRIQLWFSYRELSNTFLGPCSEKSLL